MFRRAFQRKFLLLALLAVTMAAGSAYALLAGGDYRAAARIQIEPPAGTSVADAQFYERQYALLQSRFLAERVIAAEGLEQDGQALAAVGLEVGDAATPARLAAYVYQAIAIEPVRQSQLVDVVARSSDPELAARIANGWAQQFVADNYEKRFGSSASQREQLSQQMEEQRLALARAEAALAAFADQNDLVVTPSTDSAIETDAIGNSRLQALNDAVIDASLRRIEARSALDESRSEPDLDAVVSLRRRRADAVEELAALGLPEGQQTPRSQALQAEIAALDRQIVRADAEADPMLQADYEQAQREEEQLRAQFQAEQSAQLEGQDEASEYAALAQEAESNRQLYDALLQRYAALGTGSGGSNNMAVVERAAVPVRPDGPSLPMVLAIAVAVALATWLAIANLTGKADAEDYEGF